MPLRSNNPRKMPAAGSSGSGGAPGNGAAALRASDWLSLAAAPTFSIMALLTAVTGQADMLCSSMQDMPMPTMSLGGMVPMYLLMSLFHLGPWLRLASSRETGTGRP